MKKWSLLGRCLSLSASVWLLAACGSSAPERTQETTTGMDRFREQAAQMPGLISATLASLNEIVAKATTNPKPAYRAFSDKLVETETMANDILQQAEAIRARGEKYFGEWEKELATIQNPDIRKRSEERRNKLLTSYKSIETAAVSAKQVLFPFLSDLKDIKTFLGNDLTPVGIGDARDVVIKANGQGAKVMEKIQDVCFEAEKVSGQLRISTNGQ
jgi:hypothetical protein